MAVNLIFLVVMVAIFYFMIIRPQKKRQNEYKDMLSKAKVGDNIITIEGIHGKIVSLDDEKMSILTGKNNNTKLIMLKSSINSIKE